MYLHLQASEIPIKQGDTVHCLDVLVSLMQYAMGGECEDEHSQGFQSIRDRLETRYNQVFSKRAKQTNILTTDELLTNQNEASLKLQRLVRWYLVNDSVRRLGTNKRMGTSCVEHLIRDIAKMREKRDKRSEDEITPTLPLH